jgi:hypothetical protein
MIEFEPGLNLIVGQNNSGKSLILSSLKLKSGNTPHKNPSLYENERVIRSTFSVLVEVSGRELETAALRRGGTITIPVPSRRIRDQSYVEEIFQSPELDLRLTKDAKGTFSAQDDRPSLEGFPLPWEHGFNLTMQNGRVRYASLSGRGENIPELVGDIWDRHVFFFAPQRFNVAKLSYGRHERLDETASNLPGVLALLIGEQGHIFAKIVRHMRELFPSVKNVSVTNLQSGHFEIRIWPTEQMITPELSQSLEVNGTGLSQALAILTAAATTDSSVLLIDEVNTFLHPGAAKSLMRILTSEYATHQYIVSTHSSEIIGMGLASSIHFIKRDEYASSVTKMDMRKLDDIATISAHIGISPADVFGYEKVVWVEGQTEELCFASVVASISALADARVKFISVVATGDLGAKRKDRELVLGIYTRMTSTISALLEGPVFSFDREGLSADDVESLRRRSKYRVMFLPRRNLECYLIHPEAIAELFARDHPHLAESASEGRIQDTIAAIAGERKYGAADKWNGDVYDVRWLAAVDGAKIVADTFSSISDAEVEYRKTAHSLSILSIILRTAPEHLAELIEYVAAVTEKASVRPSKRAEKPVTVT